MRRRQFIAGIGSTAAWPVVARAQQPERMPVVGYLGLLQCEFCAHGAEPRPDGVAGDPARTDAEHDGGSEATDLSSVTDPATPTASPRRVSRSIAVSILPQTSVRITRRFHHQPDTTSPTQPARGEPAAGLRQLYVAEIKPYHYASMFEKVRP
jgi:hypothetical protein